MPLTLKPGLHAGITWDDYRALDATSASGLKVLSRSPAHYKASLSSPSTPSQRLGTAAHAAILEPDRFRREFVDTGVDDARKSEFKQAAKSIGERALKSTDYAAAVAMSAQVHANPRAAALLEHADTMTEAVVVAVDPETGVMVKCRFDAINPVTRRSADLKSCRDARPDQFLRAAYDYGYHISAALYVDAYRWATGDDLEYEIIAVESAAPHLCRPLLYDETAIQEGRAECRRLLRAYADCMSRDVWPGYEYWDDDYSGVDVISLPTWRINQIENELELQIGE